jgi:hypothetical protein
MVAAHPLCPEPRFPPATKAKPMDKAENRFYREPIEADIRTAARAVIWAWHKPGAVGSLRLYEMIGALEKIVGRPKNEWDI